VSGPSKLSGDLAASHRRGRDPREVHILFVTLGSRGDVQPFFLLARELKARGISVTIVANSDYRDLAASFGHNLVHASPTPLGDVFQTEGLRHLFDQYVRNRSRKLSQVLELKRALQNHFTGVMLNCLQQIRTADLVVYNPFAFFVGELARELAVPSIRVSSQPLLPSRNIPLSVFGGRELGAVGNRLSYEVLRVATAIALRSVFRDFRRASGLGRALHAFANPLTLAMRSSHQLLAFSPALSPDPGDWPVPVTRTGFWFDEPRPGETLPSPLSSFLESGPPPLYVGFGSMVQGAARNTELILQALAIWGGRAILARGAGGLKPPEALPPNLFTVGAASHALLLPRCVAIVHHGGSGTTGAALRAGLPAVICPVLGDQLYWGRRTATVGAAEQPVALGRVTPEELAARIGRATGEERFRAAAGRMSGLLAREPGIAAAADFTVRLAMASREGGGRPEALVS